MKLLSKNGKEFKHFVKHKASKHYPQKSLTGKLRFRGQQVGPLGKTLATEHGS